MGECCRLPRQLFQWSSRKEARSLASECKCSPVGGRVFMPLKTKLPARPTQTGQPFQADWLALWVMKRGHASRHGSGFLLQQWLVSVLGFDMGGRIGAILALCMTSLHRHIGMAMRLGLASGDMCCCEDNELATPVHNRQGGFLAMVNSLLLAVRFEFHGHDFSWDCQ